MNPPVDAPTSRQERPETATPSASRALASFTPPRDTYAGATRDLHVDAGVDELRRLAREPRGDVDLAGHHGRGRPRAGLEQAALGQQAVEPDPRHGSAQAPASEPRGSSTAASMRSAIASPVKPTSWCRSFGAPCVT